MPCLLPSASATTSNMFGATIPGHGSEHCLGHGSHGMESMAWCKSVQKAMKKKNGPKPGFDMCFANLLQCVQRDIETKKTLLAFRRCFAALGILGPSVVSCCSRFQDLSVSCWFQRCNFFVTVHFPSFRRTFWCWDCRKDLQQSVFLGAGTALDICTLNPSSLRFKIYLHCFEMFPLGLEKLLFLTLLEIG